MRIVEVRFDAIEKADGSVVALDESGVRVLRLRKRQRQRLANSITARKLRTYIKWGRWSADGMARVRDASRKQHNGENTHWGRKWQSMLASTKKRKCASKRPTTRRVKARSNWVLLSNNWEAKLRYKGLHGEKDEWRTWSQNKCRNMERRHFHSEARREGNEQKTQGFSRVARIQVCFDW